jgi:hypothetical protein
MVCVGHGYLYHNQGIVFPIKQNATIWNQAAFFISDRNQSQQSQLTDGPDKLE